MGVHEQRIRIDGLLEVSRRLILDRQLLQTECKSTKLFEQVKSRKLSTLFRICGNGQKLAHGKKYTFWICWQIIEYTERRVQSMYVKMAIGLNRNSPNQI